MTVHVHQLDGCAPNPLAHYLKALAILRLVSEQRDAEARGWWTGESFCLATSLSRDDLLRFFADEYRPTPILSPWNAGSGFYYEEDAGLTPIERSTAARFAPFREGIASARVICAPLGAAMQRLKEAEEALKSSPKSEALKETKNKAKTEKDDIKDGILAACRRSWSGGLLQWLDAALAINADGGASWPALLGSGGNDGRLDFTNNSMQHLATLFDLSDPVAPVRPAAKELLLAALFGEAARGLSDKAAGQFIPGNAGGDNMGAGFDGKSRINPWDFVLMLEGTIFFTSSVARRTDASELPQAAAPFAVRPSAAGYGSAADADQGPRGEQWMPLWGLPGKYAEVHALFREGRVRIGRNASTRAIDIARGVARLGVARGVTEFQRFGYIERNGQSKLAVPLGRWRVSSQPHAELLDDVVEWVGRLRAAAGEDRAPKALVSAFRLVDEAMFATCRSGRDPNRWQTLLFALGRAEAAVLRSPRTAADPKRKLSPLSPLRAEWIEAADDGSVEVRLAVALASQEAAFRFDGATTYANVRAHWIPIDPQGASRAPHSSRRPARFATDAAGLRHDPNVVCVGEQLERDLLALVARRVQMASSLKERGLGLFAPHGREAALGDVMAFLAGRTDDARILGLARALMAISWGTGQSARPVHSPSSVIDAGYAVMRITHLSAPLRRGEASVEIPLDPEPTARLASGNVAAAAAVSLRRLRSSGFRPTTRVLAGSAAYARRLAASLVFPISASDASRCADLVTKPYLTDPA